MLPELISTDKDAEQTKGLNYTGPVPVTIKAIQEQQAQIKEQQERITEQQEQLERGCCSPIRLRQSRVRRRQTPSNANAVLSGRGW